MVKNGIQYFILTAVCLFLLAGCNREAANDEPVSLPEVACQPEDVSANPPFTIAATRTAVPPQTPLADQIETYYGVSLIENRLTNTSAFCDLYELADETAAADMLHQVCEVSEMTEAEPPAVGEEACALESTGFRQVNFRQGRVAGTLSAALDWLGVGESAGVLKRRLPKRN